MIIWPGLRRGVSAMQRLFNSFYFYAPRTSSITQSRGSGTPTNTRATVATVMGYAADATLADGQTLLTVASGELRFQGARRVSEGVWSNVDADGNPIPAATLKGAVVEKESTNLIWPSNDFSSWTDAGTACAVTMDSVGPDGQVSAWTFTDNSAASAEGRFVSFSASAATHTASILVKKTVGAQAAYPVFRADNSVSVAALATIDTTNGVATIWTAYTGLTIATSSAKCRSYNDELWLVSLTFLATATTWRVFVYPAVASSATQATGTEDASLQGSAVFYGAQVELGSYATEYITTTTVAATRNKDVLDDQVASNLTAAAGSVAFTWTPSHDPSGTIALGGSYVDASNYTVLLHDATKYIWRKRIAGVNYDAELTAAYANGTTAKGSIEWGAAGHNLSVDGVLGTANTTGIEGVQYGKLTGVVGTYFSTPDSAANSITGDIDIRVKVAMTDWTPSANMTLASKYLEASNKRSYMLRLTIAGKLEAYVSANGITDTLAGLSSAATGFSGSVVGFVRWTYDADDGAGNRVSKFYTSTDGLDWTQLGTTQTTAGATALNDNDAQVLLGALNATSESVDGRIYYAQIYDGIDGTLAVDFNPADYTHGTTWTSSTTGEVYTINGNAAVWPAVKLGTRWQWGSDGNGGQQAGAAIKEMYLSPRALSDSELMAITA